MVRRNQPEFDTDTVAEPALKCPECGDPWLHQCGVDVFVRNTEDDERGQRATVSYDGSVEVAEDVSSESGNPSRRRDGIKIKFSCEFCSTPEEDGVYELVIAQHKGNEFVYWEDY